MYGMPTNIGAYLQGKRASIEGDSEPIKTKNPYPKDSEDYYSWNQGWNSDCSFEIK